MAACSMAASSSAVLLPWLPRVAARRLSRRLPLLCSCWVRGPSPRGYSSGAGGKGLVLGIYSSEKDKGVAQFTSAGEAFDRLVSGKLRELLSVCGPPLKKGKTRMFHGLHQDFPSVVVVGLGKKNAGVNDQENWNEGKENIRAAVAVGCRQIQDLEIPCVEVDPCGDAQAAAEGAILGLHEYNELSEVLLLHRKN